jgi:hypothetical protein
LNLKKVMNVKLCIKIEFRLQHWIFDNKTFTARSIPLNCLLLNFLFVVLIKIIYFVRDRIVEQIL